MKYALTLKYISLEGIEHALDVLPAETTEQRTRSLSIIQENTDFVGFLSDEQITQIDTLLKEGTSTEEALNIPITAENYPLFIVAMSVGAQSNGIQGAEQLQFGENFAEINNEAFNEATLCDGGPNRKETLRHAREAFRQIGSISETILTLPTIFESLQSRLAVLEGTTVPQNATETPVTEETPTTEADTLSPDADTIPSTEAIVTTADVPSEETDTPISAVVVESPLDGEGNAPASQTANEEETETDAVTETDPESAETPVLSIEARSSLRRLTNGRRNAGVTL